MKIIFLEFHTFTFIYKNNHTRANKLFKIKLTEMCVRVYIAQRAASYPRIGVYRGLELVHWISGLSLMLLDLSNIVNRSTREATKGSKQISICYHVITSSSGRMHGLASMHWHHELINIKVFNTNIPNRIMNCNDNIAGNNDSSDYLIVIDWDVDAIYKAC